MIKSKYLGKEFDNGWKCVHVGIANVQGKRTKWSGHRNYYYIFERITSDKAARKMVRLSSPYAAKVFSGRMHVEEYAKRFAAKHSKKYVQRVIYAFN